MTRRRLKRKTGDASEGRGRLVRQAIDEWIPRAARVLGIALIPVAVYDRGHTPFLYPLIIFLLGYKTVKGSGD